MKKLLLLYILSAICSQLSAQSEWMSRLSDDQMVCKLSIPGTHDALTAEGFVDPRNADDYTTQVAGLKEQLEGGLRYFDIRLIFNVVEGDTILQTSHRTAAIKFTYDDVIDRIRTFLTDHPMEFVIIKVQYDGDLMKTADSAVWCRLMHRTIYHNNGLFAQFRPDMKVRDVRGRILMISRSPYGEPIVGALTSWLDEGTKDYVKPSGQFECDNELVNGDLSARFFVQDYYNTVGSRIYYKLKAIEQMFRSSQDVPSNQPVWILNHTSGYGSPKMNALGYAENASKTNQKLMELLNREEYSAPVGIIAMDYACIDTLDREIGTLGRIQRKVMSKALTEKIIERNFK